MQGLSEPIPRERLRNWLVLTIAIDVENILTDAGLSVAGDDANDAEVALLDIHLLDSSCEPVARRLEKGIRFVVFSGESKSDESLDPIFRTGMWLVKPAPADRMVAAVRAALVDGVKRVV